MTYRPVGSSTTAAFLPRSISGNGAPGQRQAWVRRLIDLARRNNLLYYRPLKTGTLDLSLADGDRMAALLSGEAVPISKPIAGWRRASALHAGGA